MKVIDNGKKVIITITEKEKVTLINNNDEIINTNNVTKIIVEKK